LEDGNNILGIFFGMKDFSQLYSLLFTKKNALKFAC